MSKSKVVPGNIYSQIWEIYMKIRSHESELRLAVDREQKALLFTPRQVVPGIRRPHGSPRRYERFVAAGNRAGPQS